ncbi:uncharacterized protein LOC127080336 [Lathyrus oleraceus]|uniref:uncharacterized protein LOC127080336 n=1 Tax=Pisum sativum TaxID=3888 RepID=UPI0021D32BAE|nr:uncharacterized protein LOC127080336 [Pisum sativum]
MSQTTDDEPNQNNEPFIPNEEVGEDSEDDQEEVRFEDLFGASDDDGNEDLIDTPTVAVRAEPINFFTPIHNADDIEEGMEFENKEACVVALQQWVSLCKGNSKWKIGKLGGPHTCTTTSMSQDHRKLNSEMISKSIMKLVNHDASLKVKVIIAHVAEKYRYIISYKKTWIAKCTIIELQTLPVISYDGSQLGDKRIFRRLFWAFRPCIRGFAYCKPIVQVDGTWLYDKYKGTMLMALAQDGNENIFPIAFTLVEGETKDA